MSEIIILDMDDGVDVNLTYLGQALPASPEAIEEMMTGAKVPRPYIAHSYTFRLSELNGQITGPQEVGKLNSFATLLDGLSEYERVKLEGAVLLTHGLTDEQIATKCHIRRETLYAWKKKYSNISNALKKGKEIVDYEVENALLNNALGYYYKEQVVQSRKEVVYEDGKRIKEITEPEVVEVERWKPGETGAQAFWLKNRKPKNWRDKPPEDNDDVFAAIP